MLYELALFAGAGGGILGSILRGHIIVGAVEIEAYPRDVLLQRQRDGILPEFPVWDDICTFRADNPECAEFIERLREVRDDLVISGGFPCQDISAAGKGAGIEGARSSLWFEMARVVREIRPRFALVENSPVITSRGLGRVLGDLAGMGYDAQGGVLSAEDAAFLGGNPAVGHLRRRYWILSEAPDADGSGLEGRDGEVLRERAGELPVGPCDSFSGWWDRDPANADGAAIPEAPDAEGGQSKRGRDRTGRRRGKSVDADAARTERSVSSGQPESRLGRVAHGLADPLDERGANAGRELHGVASGPRPDAPDSEGRDERAESR